VDPIYTILAFQLTLSLFLLYACLFDFLRVYVTGSSALILALCDFPIA